MSRLYPGNERRLPLFLRLRVFLVAGFLAFPAAGLVLASVLWRVRGVNTGLDWLWLLPLVSGFLLGAAALMLCLTVLRELRQHRAQ